MALDSDETSNDGMESINKNSEYDHFNVSGKITINQVADEIAHSEINEKRIFHLGKGSCRGSAKVLKLLRQKLLEHKWGDAALIMEGLSSQAVTREYQQTETFWKVGNEVIYNHPATRYEPDIVLRHRQATKVSGKFSNPAHILYEYVLYLLVRKDFKMAREALAFFETSLFRLAQWGSKKDNTAWFDRWSPMLSGYSGMLDYISWKEMRTDLNSGFILSGDDDEEHSIKKMTAEQAVAHFEVLLATPGVWDIFMRKYIELLEYLGQVGDAEEALRTNSLQNPANPNAHKYWYEFLCRHPDIPENKEAQIQALSNLHEVEPSSEYMLELHSLRLGSALNNLNDQMRLVSMISLALEILMDMLDYETWIMNEKAWKTLSNSLRKTKKVVNEDFSKILNEIWFASKRNTWWPKYHFTLFRAKQALSSSVSLAKSKSSLAALLADRNSEFCNFINRNDHCY